MTEFSFNLGPRRHEDEIVVAHVKFTQLRGNPAPHFSITGTTYSTERTPGERAVAFDGRHWWPSSFGCIHDTIAAAFPELAPFLKWHLADPEGPMHYVANAVYFAQIAQGVALHMRPEDTRERAIAGFRSTVVLDDAAPLPECMTRDLSPNAPDVRHTVAYAAYAKTMREQIATEITAWCEARHAQLRADFAAALEACREIGRALS